MESVANRELPATNYQLHLGPPASADGRQHDATSNQREGRHQGNALRAVGLDPDLGSADLYAMFLAARNTDEQGSDAEDEQQNAEDEKSTHASSEMHSAGDALLRGKVARS